ncbi:MAG: penicillin-insensitive murein endopeptidase [Deltaproteobacteria bacterium]|nr:penicillin-insensitive murein endopeptidase [Deltaproteobacteria bacterium]MBW2375073.1 penicillin-insensitive murein endopeptidase [Deltaproteobacteria bacterium]
MVRFFAAAVITAICSCVTEPLPPGQTISVGTTDHGYLHDPVRLADRGTGYRRLRPGEGTRFGTPTLVGAIERAARAVADAFPGGRPLRVGDLSTPHGGAHSRHRTHRTGRDADLLFFARDAGGLAAHSDGWLRFDRFGLATLRDRVFRFDEARNWHLVRTLITDDQARVKWIFCSNELKARLLRYAARYERSPQAVLRATWVLHQPARADAHDDHFHLRVGCGTSERRLGCREQAPHWPWLSDTARKEDSNASPAESDTHLVRWLLAEEHVDQRRDIAGRRLDAAAQPAAIAGR